MIDLSDLDTALEKIEVPIEYPLTFFSQWAWWVGCGRPERMFDAKTLVLCPQDNQYHTPGEIKERGW